ARGEKRTECKSPDNHAAGAPPPQIKPRQTSHPRRSPKQGVPGAAAFPHDTHFGRPCKAIMAASAASFWSLPQGGPADFPSVAILFIKALAEVASAHSACSVSSFSGIATSLK